MNGLSVARPTVPAKRSPKPPTTSAPPIAIRSDETIALAVASLMTLLEVEPPALGFAGAPIVFTPRKMIAPPPSISNGPAIADQLARFSWRSSSASIVAG